MFLNLLTRIADGQVQNICDASCVQLSKLEYLIIIENNSCKSLFLPINLTTQKSNDTLFINHKFFYDHYKSTIFKYTIGGVKFETNAPLGDYIKPDSVYKESNGYIPNFAVPSELFELKPHDRHVYQVSNSDTQQPRKFSCSIYLQKNTAFQNKQTILGEIVPAKGSN